MRTAGLQARIFVFAGSAQLQLRIFLCQQHMSATGVARSQPGAGLEARGPMTLDRDTIYCTAPSSPGAPRRLRSGEQEAIISAKVST